MDDSIISPAAKPKPAELPRIKPGTHTSFGPLKQIDAGVFGKLVNAEGRVNEPEVYGRRSKWLDWTATLEGEKVGVAIFDHPSNYGYPTRWTVRAMGLMFANPFA